MFAFYSRAIHSGAAFDPAFKITPSTRNVLRRLHILFFFCASFSASLSLSHSSSTPGNGLGLSLVASIAQVHGATLLLDDARPGLRATLRFPS